MWAVRLFVAGWSPVSRRGGVCTWRLLLGCGAELLDDELLHDGLQVLEGHARSPGLEAELRVLADGAADEDVASGYGLGLALCVDLARGRAHDANVGDLDLGARVGAPGPVDAERRRDVELGLQRARHHVGVALGLDEAEAAELRPGARDRVPDDVARVDREVALVQRLLGQQSGDVGVLDVCEDCILVHRDAALAARVLVGQVGQVAALLHREAARGHVDADAAQAGLDLRVHAQELAAGPGRRILRLLDVDLRLLARG
mmetsp:Transcript_10633/g.35247  ORF Transcript_10633/g.35247 Transcript_10633/m.35247 type:complete len:260 (-) Transcript_10633:1109-1888(-)